MPLETMRKCFWHDRPCVVQDSVPRSCGGSVMSVVYNLFLLAFVFIVMKAVQIGFDFFYTTYKSVTIHKNLEHAFNPGLAYRLKRGLVGDICYFIAGVVVAVNADTIRGLF